MKCNIDARGRKVRALSGAACGILGLAGLVAGALGYESRVTPGFGGLLLLAGLFQLFEARKGWCALRAAGVKTPF